MTLKGCEAIVKKVTLLLAFSQISPALVLPISTTLSSTAFAAEQTGAECFPARVLASRLADTKSCLQAVLRLPDYADPGVFHNGNPSDIYKLPVVKKFGPCIVTVSITGSNRERSSWTQISSAASMDAAICSVGQYPQGTTGGTVYVGSQKRIRITLEHFPQVISSYGGGQNETLTS